MSPPQARSRMTFLGRRFPDRQFIAVQVEDGRVAGDEPVQVPDGDSPLERWIVPGFCDVQVNGFAGRDFNVPDLKPEDVAFIAAAQFATGVTRFLPTVITAPLAAMCRGLDIISAVMESDELAATVCPGIHVEGPFIHPEDGPRGAHPKHAVRPPSIEDYERLQAAARGRVIMLTLAPDQPGAVELIRHVAAQGVVVALGHHRADGDAVAAAVEAGARLCTHLGNGSDAVMPRHPNVVWEQLGEDRLWASFIADGHHLPPKVLRSMLRAKGLSRSVLVTDAMGAAGMAPGLYPLGDIEVELLASGRVVLRDTPYLAGSSASMPEVIGKAVTLGGLTFQEAVALGTVRPRMLLPDWSGKPWSCFAGSAADMVELDWDAARGVIHVRQVTAGRFGVTLREG